MMFVIIMRGEEEKEVFKNLEGRLLSTKSLFENPDMSIQLFKFFYGRLVKVVNSVLVNLGPWRPQKDSIMPQEVKSISMHFQPVLAIMDDFGMLLQRTEILGPFYLWTDLIFVKKIYTTQFSGKII